KNTLGTQSMKGVLGIEVIWHTVAFYALVSQLTGLYIMCKLPKINVPDCFEDFTKPLIDLTCILLMSDVFYYILSSQNHKRVGHN
ncbi:hypothetical protein CLU79DRAFT_692074, partial [Phycomyces nitens]